MTAHAREVAMLLILVAALLALQFVHPGTFQDVTGIRSTLVPNG